MRSHLQSFIQPKLLKARQLLNLILVNFPKKLTVNHSFKFGNALRYSMVQQKDFTIKTTKSTFLDILFLVWVSCKYKIVIQKNKIYTLGSEIISKFNKAIHLS